MINCTAALTASALPGPEAPAGFFSSAFSQDAVLRVQGSDLDVFHGYLFGLGPLNLLDLLLAAPSSKPEVDNETVAAIYELRNDVKRLFGSMAAGNHACRLDEISRLVSDRTA